MARLKFIEFFASRYFLRWPGAATGAAVGGGGDTVGLAAFGGTERESGRPYSRLEVFTHPEPAGAVEPPVAEEKNWKTCRNRVHRPRKTRSKVTK